MKRNSLLPVLTGLAAALAGIALALYRSWLIQRGKRQAQIEQPPVPPPAPRTARAIMINFHNQQASQAQELLTTVDAAIQVINSTQAYRTSEQKLRAMQRILEQVGKERPELDVVDYLPNGACWHYVSSQLDPQR